MKALLLALVFVSGFAFAEPADKNDIQDIKISIAKLQEAQASTQKQIENNQYLIQKQMDFQQNLLLVLISSIIALVGYITWDRKTTLAPITKIIKNSEDEQLKLDRRIKQLEDAITEIGKAEPKFAKLLHKFGLF